MGGGGKSKSAPAPIFMPPPPDNSFSQFLQAQQADKQRADQRVEDERKAAADKETARKASGAAGFGGLRSGLESQLRQGLITYNDASSQLRDYGGKYELNPEEAVNTLSDVYTKELLPGRRATGTTAAYQELLGREATEEEKKTSMDRFNTGYYSSVQDLKIPSLKDLSIKINSKRVILVITMTQCMVKKKEILKASEQVNERLNLIQVFFLHMLQELKVKLVYLYLNLVTL